MTQQQRKWLKRRQAIEPLIGHNKSDDGMQRGWLKGALGDALHAFSCAAGYNIRWLMRAISAQAAKDARAFFFALFRLGLWDQNSDVGRRSPMVGLLSSRRTAWPCAVRPEAPLVLPLSLVFKD